MPLEKELAAVRKEVVTDGYDMSIGEVVSLYREKELIINPEFQRYFRWDPARKTKFIESILLGIPIPPIFIFQRSDGIWELIDGLQRISTLLEFMNMLEGPEGRKRPPFVLGGTRLLPSLADHSWDKQKGTTALSPAQKIDIKRARIRVEILKRESDPTSKFELFQRLNTGGAALSEQEVRNCTMVMIDRSFFQLIKNLSEYDNFRKTISLTENANEKQFGLELVLRVLSSDAWPYTKGLDVHEYLDEATIRLASDKSYNRPRVTKNFKITFDKIHSAFHGSAFRRWDGKRFAGKFLLSVFEVIAIGAFLNTMTSKSEKLTPAFIKNKSKALWKEPIFNRYSGAGVRGTDRIANLQPFAKKFLAP